MKNLFKNLRDRTTPSSPVYSYNIVRKHLEDRNHVITDEEISNVKITTEHINVSEHPMVKGIGRS